MGIKVCPLGVLLMLIITPTLGLQAAEPAKSSQRVEVRGNLITIDAKDADLSSLLKEIGLKTKVRMDIGKGVAGKKIAINLKNMDVERALRAILDADYLFVLTKEKTDDRNVLKQVRVVGDFSLNLSPKKMTTINIQYGSGKEDIGVIREPMVGPKSFAVDDRSNIYILDTVNSRIQVFSSEGKLRLTIPLQKGIFGTDILIDRANSIYIYDPPELYQFDKSGNILNKIGIDERRWEVGIELHLVDDDTIYIYACTENMCGDFILGKIIDGRLVESSSEEIDLPVERGKFGFTGLRYYSLELIKEEYFELRITEKDGRSFKLISCPLKGVGSVSIMGEDRWNNFYISIHRLQDNKDLEEVHKFSLDGDHLMDIALPESRTLFWTAKDILIVPDGTIYQFSPGRDQLTLNVLKDKSN